MSGKELVENLILCGKKLLQELGTAILIPCNHDHHTAQGSPGQPRGEKKTKRAYGWGPPPSAVQKTTPWDKQTAKKNKWSYQQKNKCRAQGWFSWDAPLDCIAPPLCISMISLASSQENKKKRRNKRRNKKKEEEAAIFFSPAAFSYFKSNQQKFEIFLLLLFVEDDVFIK